MKPVAQFLKTRIIRRQRLYDSQQIIRGFRKSIDFYPFFPGLMTLPMNCSAASNSN